MNATMRRVVIGTAAVSMALSMAACGKAGDKKDDSGGNSSSGGGKTIGLLLPDSVTARYEKFDKPYFEDKVKSLCSDCKVEYANAAGDAGKQAQQESIEAGFRECATEPFIHCRNPSHGLIAIKRTHLFADGSDHSVCR